MTRQQWRDLVDHDEHYLVSAIKKQLLTQQQRDDMYKREISIEDVLNGRTDDKHTTFVSELMEAWNRKLGWREFDS